MFSIPAPFVVEMTLRAAVPEGTSDSDFIKVNWADEAQYIVECLKRVEEPFTDSDLCKALGHMTAMRVLRNAGLVQ